MMELFGRMPRYSNPSETMIARTDPCRNVVFREKKNFKNLKICDLVPRNNPSDALGSIWRGPRHANFAFRPGKIPDREHVWGGKAMRWIKGQGGLPAHTTYIDDKWQVTQASGCSQDALLLLWLKPQPQKYSLLDMSEKGQNLSGWRKHTLLLWLQHPYDKGPLFLFWTALYKAELSIWGCGVGQIRVFGKVVNPNMFWWRGVSEVSNRFFSLFH